MRIIAIINQKGGCGKTTTAINLAGVFAKGGLRTLLVDLDPQSHCAAGLGVPEQRIDLDIGDAMVSVGGKALDTSRLLWRVGRNLDLAPSRMKLAGLEASRGGLADKPDKERRLSAVLAQLAGDYDVACIDCSPAIGLLTFNALTAATTVLIPVETGYFSLQGAAKQVHTVTTLGKRLGVEVPVWLLATLHDEDNALSVDLLHELRRRFERKVIPLIIRRDVRLREAASFGQPVIEYDPGAPGSEDYTALGKWLTREMALAREEGDSRGGGAPTDGGIDLSSTDSPTSVRVVTSPKSQAELARRVMGIPTAPGPADDGHSVTLAASKTAAPSQVPASDPPGGLSRTEDMVRRAQRFGRRDTAVAPSEPIRVTTSEPIAPPAAPIHEPVGGPIPLAAPSPHGAEVKPGGRRDTVARLAGARVTRAGAVFMQPIWVGGRVCVAGDFNGWSATAHPMTRNESLGVHELRVDLPPGKHRYRLVIDGQWSADPFNTEFELNPFGEANSVVQVGPAQRGTA